MWKSTVSAFSPQNFLRPSLSGDDCLRGSFTGKHIGYDLWANSPECLGFGRPGFLSVTHGPPTSPGIPKHLLDGCCAHQPLFPILPTVKAYRKKMLRWKSGSEIISVPIHGQKSMRSRAKNRSRHGLAVQPSPSFATIQPEIVPKRAGRLGYPSDWRTTADLLLEQALAGPFPCSRWIHSGAVRVGFGRSSLLI